MCFAEHLMLYRGEIAYMRKVESQIMKIIKLKYNTYNKSRLFAPWLSFMTVGTHVCNACDWSSCTIFHYNETTTCLHTERMRCRTGNSAIKFECSCIVWLLYFFALLLESLFILHLSINFLSFLDLHIKLFPVFC